MKRTITALKRHLAAHDIPQDRLSKLTGISEPRVSRLCGGLGAPPTPEELATICEALSVEIETVWPFSGLSHLDGESQQIAKFCEWLNSQEGRLVIRRVKAAIGDAA